MNDKNLFDENENQKIEEQEKDIQQEKENQVEEKKEEKKSAEVKSDEEERKKEFEDEVKERKEELRNKLKEGMAQNNNKNNKNKDKDEENKFKQLGGKFNFKGFIMLLFIITLVMSLPAMLSDTGKTPSNEISYTEFVQSVKDGKIKKVDEKEGYIYGYTADEKEVFSARMITDRLGGDVKLVETIEANGAAIKSVPPQQMPLLLNVLISWFPMLLLIGVWIFMMNKMGKGNGGGPQIFNVGKSKAKENGEDVSKVTFDDVATEGITKITSKDIKYAKAMHRAIKLLASSRKVGDSYTCLVAPYMIDDTHPLSGVNGVFNGVFLRGNVLGDAMFYGSGAGKLPTASAVVADVVDMTKHQNTNIYIDWKPEKLTLVSYDDSVNSFFVRTDSPKSEVEAVFGHVDYIEDVVDGEYAFTTGDMTEKDFADKASKVNVINRIRL